MFFFLIIKGDYLVNFNTILFLEVIVNIKEIDNCSNLSLITKRLGKPLKNGYCGLQFLRVCQNLCLKSKRLEKPPRTGHLNGNSLGFVTISPLQLKDFRSFQEVAKQGNNSSKFLAISPLNLKYLRIPKELLIFKAWATILWGLSR